MVWHFFNQIEEKKQISLFKGSHGYSDGKQERDFIYIEDAIKMTEAGADIIVTHMGLTTSGNIGAQTSRSLLECVSLIDDWSSAAKSIREDVIILCHGGPIAMPEDANYILQNCKNIHGFYGASSMERLPTELALTEQTRAFKKISF